MSASSTTSGRVKPSPRSAGEGSPAAGQTSAASGRCREAMTTPSEPENVQASHVWPPAPCTPLHGDDAGPAGRGQRYESHHRLVPSSDASISYIQSLAGEKYLRTRPLYPLRTAELNRRAKEQCMYLETVYVFRYREEDAHYS
jgi:hypothetical protein